MLNHAAAELKRDRGAEIAGQSSSYELVKRCGCVVCRNVVEFDLTADCCCFDSKIKHRRMSDTIR